MEKVKLTKKALNEFLQWTNTKYNDYLQYGTKSQNVEIALNSLNAGHYVNGAWTDKNKTEFVLECASAAGENAYLSSGYRNWRLKSKRRGSERYHVDCINRCIKEERHKGEIHFL